MDALAKIGLTVAAAKALVAKRKKAAKIVRDRVNEAWNKYGNGVEISVLDIPKIFCEAAFNAAKDGYSQEAIDREVLKLIAKYRKN